MTLSSPLWGLSGPLGAAGSAEGAEQGLSGGSRADAAAGQATLAAPVAPPPAAPASAARRLLRPFVYVAASPSRWLGSASARLGSAARAWRASRQLRVSSMCAPMDPLRWRHRPLLFYFVTLLVAHGLTPLRMRRHGFVRRREGALSYWHKRGARVEKGPASAAPSALSASAPDALVFIHGIGFGVAPYVRRTVEEDLS